MPPDRNEHAIGQVAGELLDKQTAARHRDSTSPDPVPPGSKQDSSEAVFGGTLPESPEGIALAARRSLAIAASEPEAAPSVLGHKALRKLGAGTYGTVWLYEEAYTAKQVAIKFFPYNSGQRLCSLQNEGKQLALLDAAPGIVQLKDVCPDADPPYLIMTFAEKGSLDDRLKKGALPAAEVLVLIRQIAEALAYVHAKGIRHCDLKPGNVLLDALGRPLLADFGQAQLCGDSSLALGTFFYMAPEQAEQELQIPDTRWDVYALGALFYVLLTGKVPREDGTLHDELVNTTNHSHRLCRYREGIGAAPKPTEHRKVRGVDRRLAEIIDQCLAVDPEKRLRDAGAVLAALDRREHQRRQRPLVVFGVLAPILLLCVMTGLAFWSVSDGGPVKNSLRSELLEDHQKRAESVAAAMDERLSDLLKHVQDRADDKKLVSAITQAKENNWEPLKECLIGLHLSGRDYLTGWSLIDKDGRDLGSYDPKPSQETRRTVAMHEVRCWLLPSPTQRVVPLILGLHDSAFQQVVGDHGLVSLEGPDPNKQNKSGWRDYFHHQGDRENRGDPIAGPRISHPYRTRTRTNGPQDGPTQIGFASPVHDADKRTVAVLVATIELQTLKNWPYQLAEDSRGTMVVLLDDRSHCVLHSTDDEKILPERDRKVPPKRWQEHCPEFSASLQRTGCGTYKDPIDEQDYLVGYAPLSRTGWGVLVQRDERDMHRLATMSFRSLILANSIGMAVVCVLTTGLLVWLIQTLRRAERVSNV